MGTSSASMASSAVGASPGRHEAWSPSPQPRLVWSIFRLFELCLSHWDTKTRDSSFPGLRPAVGKLTRAARPCSMLDVRCQSHLTNPTWSGESPRPSQATHSWAMKPAQGQGVTSHSDHVLDAAALQDRIMRYMNLDLGGQSRPLVFLRGGGGRHDDASPAASVVPRQERLAPPSFLSSPPSDFISRRMRRSILPRSQGGREVETIVHRPPPWGFGVGASRGRAPRLLSSDHTVPDGAVGSQSTRSPSGPSSALESGLTRDGKA